MKTKKTAVCKTTASRLRFPTKSLWQPYIAAAKGGSVRNQEQGANALPHLHPAMFLGTKGLYRYSLCSSCVALACLTVRHCWRRIRHYTAMLLKSHNYFIIPFFQAQALCDS